VVCASLFLRLPSRMGLTKYVGRRTCYTKKLISPSCTRYFIGESKREVVGELLPLPIQT
jgi:hypothetical protein